jgi:cation diffusion facilitator CzcD-associated flavoprotein CzcO
VVLGAGAAGLAVAHALRAAGLEAIVLERAPQPGESWRRRYDGLRLNTVRTMSSLPGYRLERRHGAWPTAQAYADYLARYAGRQSFDVRFGVEATRIDRGGQGWTVATSEGTIASRVVVVATGHDREPRLPDWPGRATFTGQLLHSADFRNGRPFAGRDVLVVGAGNSGCEIAAHLARDGARAVQLSVRSGPLVLARRYLGVALTYWSYPGRLAPDRLLDLIGPRMQRTAFGDLSRHGLPRPGRGRTLSAQRHSRYIPTVDGEFVAALRSGAITVVDPVGAFDGDVVVLDGGRHLTPDAVIAATGYRAGLEPLVDHLDVLDGAGLPRGRQLPHAPGLFFAGYRFDLSAGLPYFKREARAIALAAVMV